jgi:hypothetical protein
MGEIEIWTYGGAATRQQALAQVYPVPALLLYDISTGHGSRLEHDIADELRRFAPFRLHEVRLAELVPALLELAAAGLGRPGDNARYVVINALSARVENGIVHVEQLGDAFACFSAAGVVAPRPHPANPAIADVGIMGQPGDRRETSVALGAGQPLLATSDFIAELLSPAEIAAALDAAPRCSPEVLADLVASATLRHRAEPFTLPATHSRSGCAALVWTPLR